MKKFHLLIVVLFLAMAPSLAPAHTGSISFTEEEIARHEQTQEQLLQVAGDCLQNTIDYHKKFFRKYGISPYYGDRSMFGKLPDAEKREYLRRMRLDPKLLSQMESTSCVGLTLKCLGKGFRAVDQADLWARVREYVMLNDVDGTALQAALQKLGWKILYWNPDIRMNKRWDDQEKAKDPENKNRYWGYHEYNWMMASKRGRYLYNTVDDARTLVNFGRRVPDYLLDIPFFVGTAHGGYHVFPGKFGVVIEAHSTRRITDSQTVQSAFFNPLGGGAPTDGTYYSGLIAVPGKYFP